MDLLKFIVLVVLLVSLYFLPTLIAYERRHHQRPAIAVLNIFLGWTFLGWVGALVWAATAVRTDPAPGAS